MVFKVKITFLNDLGNSKNFEEYISIIGNGLDKEKYQHELINITNLNIKQCSGCFSCWLKTPGKCFYNEDMEIILETIVKTYILIFSSYIVTGFISSKLKILLDRLIPLLLPYFKIFNNEFHHKTRYEKLPVLGIILQKNANTKDIDLEIIEEYYKRVVVNFNTRLSFLHTTDINPEVVSSEISNI